MVFSVDEQIVHVSEGLFNSGFLNHETMYFTCTTTADFLNQLF